jgi:hypothetical protein
MNYEKDEHFYLKSIDSIGLNPASNWNGKFLPFNVKVTGCFSKDSIKQNPADYNFKGNPRPARVFWFKKIEYLSKPATLSSAQQL